MINKETKISLYREMLRIRLIEEKIAALYPEQEMRCPVHLSIGQEAVPVAVCAQMTKDEFAAGDHRSHAQYLAKGGDLKAFMAELYGKATGCCAGKGGSMHLIDAAAGFLGAVPIVGSIIPISVGAAFGKVMSKESAVVVPFFGDGAIEEGTFHESINFAAIKKLPVIFICENNFFSVYSPLSVRQPKGLEIFEIAKSYGIDSFQGDGNNVLEVYEIAGKALDKARRGEGPTFLEFKTYRWREHCGPNYDNNLGYRSEDEFEEWKEKCPIHQFEIILKSEGVLTDQDIQTMTNEINEEINEAVKFAKESPLPDKNQLMEHVYAGEVPERIKSEKKTVEVLPSH